MASYRLLALFPILVLLLVGCHKDGSVSKNQCAAGDWQTIGYRDGALGLRQTRLLVHQDACVPLGVIPDRTAYREGWDEGIAEYCRPDNGYSEGLRGAQYANVCPRALNADFLAAFDDGRALYDARAAVYDLERAIQQSENRLVSLEAEAVRTSTAQFNPVLSPSQRVELVAKVKRIIDERARIEVELPEMRAELIARQQELHDVERVPASLRD